MSIERNEPPLTRRELRERERLSNTAAIDLPEQESTRPAPTSRRASTQAPTAAGEAPVLVTPPAPKLETPAPITIEPTPAERPVFQPPTASIPIQTPRADAEGGALTERTLTRREMRALLAQQAAERATAENAESSEPQAQEPSDDSAATAETEAPVVVQMTDERVAGESASGRSESAPEREASAEAESEPDEIVVVPEADSRTPFVFPRADAGAPFVIPVTIDEPIAPADPAPAKTAPAAPTPVSPAPSAPVTPAPKLDTALFSAVGPGTPVVEEKATEITGSFHPPVEHLQITEELDNKERDAESSASFDDLIARGVSSTGAVTTTNALILPSSPNRSTARHPITETGEILVTGTIDLPRGLGATGQHPNRYDSADVDRLYDVVEPERHPSESTPVRASSAISTHTSTRGVIAPSPRRRINSTVVLAVTAGFLLVGVIVVVVGGVMFNLF